MRKSGLAPVGFETTIGGASVDDQIAKGNMFCGTPETVYQQIRKFHDHVGGVGHLMLMMQAGPMDTPDVVKNLTLFAKEVYPRLKELSPVKGAGARMISHHKLPFVLSSRAQRRVSKHEVAGPFDTRFFAALTTATQGERDLT